MMRHDGAEEWKHLVRLCLDALRVGAGDPDRLFDIHALGRRAAPSSSHSFAGIVPPMDTRSAGRSVIAVSTEYRLGPASDRSGPRPVGYAGGSIPFALMTGMAAGAVRNWIRALAASGSLASAPTPAENRVKFCSAGGNGPTSSPTAPPCCTLDLGFISSAIPSRCS